MHINFFVVSGMSRTASLDIIEGIQTHLKSHLSTRGLIITNNVRRSRKKRTLTIAISTSLTKTLSCNITHSVQNGQEGVLVNIIDQHSRVTASITKPEKFFKEIFKKIFESPNQPKDTSSEGMMGDALLAHGLEERVPLNNLFVSAGTPDEEGQEVVGDFNSTRINAAGESVALQG